MDQPRKDELTRTFTVPKVTTASGREIPNEFLSPSEGNFTTLETRSIAKEGWPRDSGKEGKLSRCPITNQVLRTTDMIKIGNVFYSPDGAQERININYSPTPIGDTSVTYPVENFYLDEVGDYFQFEDGHFYVVVY